MDLASQTQLRQHRKSHFGPAFLFLAKERRRALKVLYAVCRTLDDVVDRQSNHSKQILDAWRDVFDTQSPQPVERWNMKPLAMEFLETAHRFRIPMAPMVDLIDKGVAMDLHPKPFQTAMETEAYCYGVAGTVGLACLPIFGVPYEEGKNYALRLGIAVQWTNLIRDIGEDAQMGRVYLPLDHLEQFGYTEGDIRELKIKPQFQPLLEYEFNVALSHYRRAEELLPQRWKNELRPARIMGSIYRTLLRKLKNKKYPVFREKIRLNLWEKAWAVWNAHRN